MKKANQRIREYAKAHGVLLWQIADRQGVIDCNFSRKLRKPLPPDEEAAIIDLIDDIARSNMEESECPE